MKTSWTSWTTFRKKLAADPSFAFLCPNLGYRGGNYWVPAEFGKNRTLSRAMCLRASALKRMVPRTSEKRAKAQRHRRP